MVFQVISEAGIKACGAQGLSCRYGDPARASCEDRDLPQDSPVGMGTHPEPAIGTRGHSGA